MPPKSVKLAVSLPREEYRQVEKARREMRIPRSAVISLAIRRWLFAMQEQEKIHGYVQGYQRCPETDRETKAFSKLGQDALAGQEWKE